jgi:hypothetical protein
MQEIMKEIYYYYTYIFKYITIYVGMTEENCDQALYRNKLDFCVQSFSVCF